MTIRSKSFIQSIGVDQHIGWTGTPYANLAVAKNDLAYLGVTLVRDAAPASYLFHFGAGAEQGLTMEDAQQVLITLAPLVGTARIVSASSKISRALGFALAVSELAEEEDADSM